MPSVLAPAPLDLLMLAESAVTTNVAVSDMERARRFYEGTLGLTSRENVAGEPGEGVMLIAGDGTRLRLHEAPDVRPPTNPVALFEVPDVAKAIEDLGRRGVQFESFDLPDTRTQGPTALKGSHQAAWFKDPDGNVLCIHHPIR